MTATMSDVIGTASLLLAIVTATMGLWYGAVANALQAKEPNLPAEKMTLRRRISPTFWGKALPLAVSSTMIALIFLPRAAGIVYEAVATAGQGRFDDLKAAFVVTEVMMGLLAVVAAVLATRLGRKLGRLCSA